jgi:hypothetical protein
MKKLSEFEEIGLSVGSLVTKKNKAYGNSFEKSCGILKILFPNGVQPKQYNSMLTIVRVLDKLFRISVDKDAFGESPWKDICGYSILEVEKNERSKKEEGKETFNSMLRGIKDATDYMEGKTQKGTTHKFMECPMCNTLVPEMDLITSSSEPMCKKCFNAFESNVKEEE